MFMFEGVHQTRAKSKIDSLFSDLNSSSSTVSSRVEW